MIISEKKLPNSRIELEIQVPESTVESEYKIVFEKVRKDVSIDGFRKGKVPLNIIEQRYQGEADRQVAESIIKKEYRQAITEKKIRPITQPEFEIDTIERNKSFTFKAVVEVMPTVELVEYKGIKAEENVCEITEEDINRELEGFRERNATFSIKDDNATAAKGDLVKFKLKRIDNIGTDDVDKVEFKDFSIILGKSNDEYGFDDDLTGMKTGEAKEVKKKYPKKYPVEELSGQTADYKIKIDEISVVEYPDLDDEFAKDLGEFDNLEQLKEDIRKNLEQYVNDRTSRRAKDQILKNIVEKSSFDIPESIVQSEVEEIFRKVQANLGKKADSIKMFAEAFNMNEEELTQKLREEAEIKIKSNLALAEIVKKEELKVSEEKYREALNAYAKNNNKSLEEIEKLVDENNQKDSIEDELALDMAVELLYENAVIEKGKNTSLLEIIENK